LWLRQSQVVFTQKFESAGGVPALFQGLRAEQRRLHDWQRWGGRQSREQVVAEASAENVRAHVERIVRESESGDVLVFLPSERDIREVGELLDPRLKKSRAELVPLFGRLTNNEQQRVFAPTQRRKIVIATNIAETLHYMIEGRPITEQRPKGDTTAFAPLTR